MTLRTRTSSVVLRSTLNEARALELRLEGWSYTEIAAELGIAPVTAQRYVKEALNEVSFERSERAAELRDLITMRNDAMIQAILPKALGGDLYSVDRIVKLQEQQAKLNGAEVRQEGGNGENGFEKPLILLPEILEASAPEVDAIPAEIVEGTATPIVEPEYQVIGIEDEQVDAIRS